MTSSPVIPARSTSTPVGYVVRFDPAAFADRAAVRRRLGYGQHPLVVCSIGGTSAGGPLLELAAKALPIARRTCPDLRMLSVCGPMIAPDAIGPTDGLEVHGYMPELHAHFAACDLAIVQGGGTTTIELTALRRPFLYLPLEGHFEQELHVAERLSRHRAGIRMSFSQTSPEMLAEQIVLHLGREVETPAIRFDGARRAAERIVALITASDPHVG